MEHNPDWSNRMVVNGGGVISRSRQIWLAALLFALAVAFNWPYLKAGFFADDFLLVNALADKDVSLSRWLGMWIGTDVTPFTNLWWQNPDLMLSFWRPIPSLIFEASISVFGKNPLPLHLLSIVIHGLAAIGVYRLAIRLTGGHVLAFLAGLFFVACEDHSVTISWISTMTDLLCTLFVVLALLGYLTYLRHGRGISLIASLGALVLALGSKESAVVAPAIMFITAVLMPQGQDLASVTAAGLRDGFRSTIRRTVLWLPALLILIVYLGAYRGLGFGKINSLQYVSPFGEPLNYLINAAIQLPVMWLGTLSIFPPLVTAFDPSLLPYAIGPGILVFTLLIYALWPNKTRAVVVWSMLFYLLALLPQMCTSASERGLYLPFVAAAIFLAFLARSIGPLCRRFGSMQQHINRRTSFFGWVTVIGILLPGVLISVIRPGIAMDSFDKQEIIVRSALPAIAQQPAEHLIVTNTNDMMQTFYFQDIAKFYGGSVPNVHLLSAAPGRFTLQRVAESSFVITTNQPGWINNTMARYVRTTEQITQGDTFAKSQFRATVLETTTDHKDVLAVRFDFFSSFDNNNLAFLRWNGESFEILNIAALPIGKTIELVDNGSLWESLL